MSLSLSPFCCVYVRGFPAFVLLVLRYSLQWNTPPGSIANYRFFSSSPPPPPRVTQCNARWPTYGQHHTRSQFPTGRREVRMVKSVPAPPPPPPSPGNASLGKAATLIKISPATVNILRLYRQVRPSTLIYVPCANTAPCDNIVISVIRRKIHS